MQEPIWEIVTPADLTFNPFTLIGKEWMLVTAGNETAHNTLTASWGGLGVLWKKDVSYIFIRPQRYTMQFLEQEDYYSLCFFDKETGLTVCFDQAAPYYQEARLVFICKKMSCQQIDPSSFLDETIDEDVYPQKDYHYLFVGSIEKVLLRK